MMCKPLYDRTVYYIKYWETDGIVKKNIREWEYQKQYMFDTEEEARAKVKKLLDNKIKSLTRKLEELRAMKF